MVKNNPLACLAPHVSVIGHVTAEELQRYLSATDAANGLANRFMFICVRRSKMLPDGGNLNPENLVTVQEQMAVAADFARNTERVIRDDEARELWHELYPRLSSGRPGLAGALTARALAHVTRISMIYALLDRSSWVRAEHLKAAVACWDYAAASVVYTFGESFGNLLADEIEDRLRDAEQGLSRTEIRDIFTRNKSRREIDKALALLEQLGVAILRKVPTKGRPAERWFHSKWVTTKGGSGA